MLSDSMEALYRDTYEAAKDVKMYVTPEGQYGNAEEIVFYRHGYLSYDEWMLLTMKLDGEEVYNYIVAITQGDNETKKRIEEENGSR
jgi:hypothetical protein